MTSMVLAVLFSLSSGSSTFAASFGFSDDDSTAQVGAGNTDNAVGLTVDLPGHPSNGHQSGSEPVENSTDNSPVDSQDGEISDEPQGPVDNFSNSGREPGTLSADAGCAWTILTDEPAGSPHWQGNSAAGGHLESLNCGNIANDGTGGGSARLEIVFVPDAAIPEDAAAPPPPPDPAVLAQQAYSELRVPEPTIGAGPDRTKLAVNLWTWLWVDNPGPLSATAAAGGVSVTATATLSSVTWSMGEPTTTGDTFSAGSTATVTCQGTGTPPPANYDWKAQPPCGYIFHWRSLRERTGGTGMWPITATTTWDVTWASNTGVTGATTLNATGNDAFDVAEYRIVLVQPGG